MHPTDIRLWIVNSDKPKDLKTLRRAFFKIVRLSVPILNIFSNQSQKKLWNSYLKKFSIIILSISDIKYL